MIKSQEQDEFIAVRVQDPRVQNEGSWNSYVDFKIFLHTNSKAFTAKTSCVRRRYSEFVWLKKKLQKNAGLVPVPDLPKKSIFSFINDDFIERRRKGLQSFLDKLLHMTVCLSDSQLHLFLQTQLPVKHIEDCVQGHTPYTVTEAILNYASSNLGWVQEEGGGAQELWPTPVPYESVESPAPHLPSLQSPGAIFSGPPNELTDVSDSDSRLSDADQTAHDLKQVIVHEQLPQEGESCIKLVVEVHPNLVGSVETEEEGGIIGSNKVTKDLQGYDCEYPAPQIDGHPEDKPWQEDTSNEVDLDQEKSVAEDVADITSVDQVIEERTLGVINEAKKGGQDVGLEQDSTERQTPKKDLYEEDTRVRIHNNEVTLDLSAVKEDSAENHREMVLESAAITVDVVLHDACEENMPDTKDHDKAEITEDHTVQENGLSEEDYSEDTAVQEEAMNVNEEHVGEVNKLNAKFHQLSSGILILGGIEEAVSTQTASVTENVSNLDANTADDNTLILKAIEIDSMQCEEMDSHIIITTHQPDTNSHGN
ncbi:sorting nexin-11 isoform X3 [Ctenopharyngodon idella]|nr:sorting nexin-11 isoform X3 [Ctenopharyngodon idella]XP_051770030.1 sorting nexin-11 isoform X3 [Ctenopharyngodon idella]XP_051770031.1 sorting nexin-11 isoform X3 [Ctenopharyngodon idella]